MNVTILALLLACGAPAPHGHDHDHDGDHGHHHDHDAPAAAAPGPVQAPLGAYTARLEPSADALKLVVLDGSGNPVAAEGEARVVLTGTGEPPQKIVLAAAGDGWSGPAKAQGAPGYLAVVSVRVGGNAESARLTWGEVPEAAPAPAPAPHDHGDGSHDHGDGTHQH